MASPFGNTPRFDSTSASRSPSAFGSTSVFASTPPYVPKSPFSTFGGTTGTTPVFALSPQASSEETHSKSFMRSLARLFNDAKYSDATIRIHNVTLPVHKSVICLQSAYFEKAFKETFDEGASGVLSFTEGSGAAHWRVFEYLYTGNYSEDLSAMDFGDDATLLKDPRVYALADMFFLEDLKALAQRKLQDKLKGRPMNDAFVECVREVYELTRSSESKIRAVVIEIVMAHASELGKREMFKELLQDGGDFAVEYVDILTKKLGLK